MTAFHGPGDLLDRHNLDPAAHGGAFMAAGAVAGPRLVVPPASTIAASSGLVWPTANLAIFNRFHVSIAKAYRYINLQVTTQSGNIQAGICSVALNGATDANLTRVAHTGIIPCPTSGPQRLDLGADATLTPGDYALFVWCDNTTAAFMHGIGTGWNASRTTFNATLAGGVPSTVVTAPVSTRWVAGLTLESAA